MADSAAAPSAGTAILRRRRPAPTIALPAVVTTFVLLAVTRKGAYASPDSAFYVGVARGLIGGDGLVAPPGSSSLAHFPPLFSFALAGLGRLSGADPLQVAAVLNPLLIGLVVLLVSVVVYRRSGSVATSVIASAVTASGLDVLVYGASALSEPLFLLLALASVVALSEATARRSNGWLVGAALLTGAACLTRYLGLALVLTGLLALVHFEGRAGRFRIAAFSACSLAAPATWVLVAGGSDRVATLHGFDIRYWALGISTVSRWVLPHFVPWPVRVAALVGTAAAGLLALGPRRAEAEARRASRNDPLSFVLGAFALTYLALVLAYRLLLDQSARLDARFLVPLHVAAVIVAAPLLHRALSGPIGVRLDRTATRRVLAAVAALVMLHGVQAAIWTGRGLVDESVDRRGLAARPLRQSTALALVRGIPADVPVYSNAATAVFLVTGRRTTSIPGRRDHLSGRPSPDFNAQLDAMHAAIERGGALVYVLPFRNQAAVQAAMASLQRRLGLTRVAGDEVAVLFRA